MVEQGDVQLSLLDEQDFMEVQSDLYPGERIVLCRNPLRCRQAKSSGKPCGRKPKTALKRWSRASTTEDEKTRSGSGFASEKSSTSPYFTLDIREGHFPYTRNEATLPKRQRLTGCMLFEPVWKPHRTHPRSSHPVIAFVRIITHSSYSLRLSNF